MKVKLSDIAEVRTGYSFRGRVDNDPAGDLSIINIGNIKPGQELDTTELKRVESKNIYALNRYQLYPGDVLFQSHGNKNGAITLDDDIFSIAATGVYVIRVINSEVLPEYLAWYLNHKNCQSMIENMRQGTGIPRVSRAEVSQLMIYVPALEKQHEITQLDHMLQREIELRKRISDLTSQYINAATWQLAKA